ncbi:MAG: hypothetical protein M0Q43_10740 [Methanothrix sp.]|jgi:hypothetical protein|nr:hypothetical protein [Methanothrix sp.]
MTRNYRILGNDLGCLKELLKPGRQEVDHYLKIYGLTEVKRDKEEEGADLPVSMP